MVYVVLGMTIFMSLLMFGFGRILMQMPPDKMNYIYGYRSKMSMKNQDTWNFAQKYAGKVWVYSSLINVVISAMIVLIFKSTDISETVTIIFLNVIQPLILLLVFPLTEIKLRKTFNKDGNFIENINQ